MSNGILLERQNKAIIIKSAVLDDCKDDNDKDGRYIYENDGVTIHNFHVKDGILLGTGSGEV